MTQSPLAERPQQDQEIRVRGSAPNFLHRGQFAYLGKGLVSRRLTEPAIDVSELPVDLIVLSHLHGDHFDRVAKAGLDRSVPILTTVQAANRLNRWGLRALPLRTLKDVTVRRSGSTLPVTALPARHAQAARRERAPVRIVPLKRGDVVPLPPTYPADG